MFVFVDVENRIQTVRLRSHQNPSTRAEALDSADGFGWRASGKRGALT